MMRSLLCIALVLSTHLVACKQPTPDEAPTSGTTEREAGVELLTGAQHPKRLPEQGVDYDATLVSMFYMPRGRADFIPYAAMSKKLLEQLVRGNLAVRHVHRPHEVYGELATSIRRLDDMRTYEVTIRKGVLWHTPSTPVYPRSRHAWLYEPRELTSKDFAFTHQILRAPEFTSPKDLQVYDELERVEVIDDHTFRLVYNTVSYEHDYATLGFFATPHWLYSHNADGIPMTPDRIEAEFGSHWGAQLGVGLGPYQYSGPNELVRHEGYHGERPAFARITLYNISDPTYNNDFETAMVGDELDPGAAERMSSSELYAEFGYTFIAWNHFDPVLEDVRVRQALAHAFDRETLLPHMTPEQRRDTGPLPHARHAPSDKAYPPEFSLARAAELLEQAGWKDNDHDGIREKTLDSGEVLTLSITMNATYDWRLNEMISAYMRTLRGLGVDASQIGYSVGCEDAQQVSGWVSAWSLYWDPELTRSWHSRYAFRRPDTPYIDVENTTILEQIGGIPGAGAPESQPTLVDVMKREEPQKKEAPKGYNCMGFSDPEVDALTEELDVTFDETKREALITQIQDRIHALHPHLFLGPSMEKVYWSKDLTGHTLGVFRPQFDVLSWYKTTE